MRNIDGMRWRAIAFLLSLSLYLSCGTARAAEFSLSGFAGTGVTVDVAFDYRLLNPSHAMITIVVSNTTPSPPTNGAVTGLAFHLPSAVSGIDSFSFSSTDDSARGYHAFLLPDGIGAGSFGTFDLGITNGKMKRRPAKENAWPGGVHINGGKPRNGIDPGFTGIFAIGLTGTHLDTLNANSFLSHWSEEDGNGPPGFVVRLQAVGEDGAGSDFAMPVGASPAQAIPEPGTLLLTGSGLFGLAASRRRR